MITNKSSIIFFLILVLFIPAVSAVFSGSYDMLNQDDASWDDSATYSRLARTLDWADVNGDGYADAIVGAYQNHSNAYGAVYILYGPQDNVTDVNIATKANVSLSGEIGLNYFFGSCVGSGDVNGDGYDDLVLGSMYAGSSSEGRIYIVYGRSANIPSGNIGTVKNASINGTTSSSEYLGIMCDTADVNGDGYDDVLAAGRGLTGNRGKTYLIYGKSTAFSGDDVITNVYNESWTSGGNGDYGWVVRRAGDVNGDGYEDVLIGAPYASAGNGSAYLIYGQSAAFNQQNYTLPSGTNATFSGETSTDSAGWSVSSAGDVDNDGYDDFLIAAPDYSSSTGRAYLLYGGAGTPWSGGYDLASANAMFTSINTNEYAGKGGTVGSWPIGGALSYGDFDFDGYSDFLVGVPDAGTGGRTNNGQVLLFYGQAARFSGNYWLNLTDADATFIGEASDYRMSTLPTGMAKNVNRESILMGAYNANTGDCKGYEMFGDEPPQPVVVVPEFSITTLLLTMLLVGGLIFAIRRHH
jgi:hypothetical protein